MNQPAGDRGTPLRERLDRLADSVSAGNGIDGAQLYRQGVRRRRRRVAATTVLVAAATALVIVGGSIWLPGVTDDSGPVPENGRPPAAGQDNHHVRANAQASDEDPGGRSAGQTVEVSQAEAERRCTIVWHNVWGPSEVKVELSDDSGPWFEGDPVLIANAREFDYSPFDISNTDERCVIPQAGLEDNVDSVELPLPAADDAAGIRAACGRFLGWDFSDWEVLTADRADDRLAALVRSTDGHIARCLLDSWYLDDRGFVDNDRYYTDPDSGFIPYVDITPMEKLQGEAKTYDDYQIHPLLTLGCQVESPGQWEADCLGAGYVSGPEPVARIVITDVTGAEHEIPVVDGWLAFAGTVINHADSRNSPGELHFTVYPADGRILAKYDEDKDLPFITLR